MDQLNNIIAPIKADLDIFKDKFKESLSGHNVGFQPMIDYIASSSGKRIRPVILLLSAKLCGKINDSSIDYAIILELLHTATLIHDDVVDNTMERRGKPSVNAQYDNRMAVLLGDYILSMAIIKAVDSKSAHVLELLGQLSKNLVEGEIDQMLVSKEVVIKEERYFEVIRKKTALLLSSCTEMGAISVDADEETVLRLRTIGENLGMIFQIKDDIFDYYEQGEIGKPTGNDIREGKITLPLIYALKNAPKEVSDEMYSLIVKQNYTPENIEKLISFAKEHNGIDYAFNKMEEIKAKTITLLEQFPESEERDKFSMMIDYIIDRKK